MISRRKLGFGLLLVFASISFLPLFGASVTALTKNDYDDPPAAYKMLSKDTIEAKFPDGRTITFKDTNNNDPNWTYKPTGGGVCTPGGSTDGIQIVGNAISGGYLGRIENVGDSIGPGGKCLVDVDSIDIIVASNGVTGVGGTGSGPTPGDEGENSCYKNNTVLTWLICGIIDGIDGMVGAMVNFIEGQLFFDREQRLTDSVKKSWSIVRNIATAVLVIVALIMVISQAVSWGPFDAYTVRRVLPRLIIAAIVMQLSWYLLYFIIQVFNNLGTGVAELMYAPFGGKDQMTLEALLGGDAAPSGFNLFTAATVGGTILAVGAAASWNIFGVLALALPVVVVVLLAFLVFALRDLLIILSVILAPFFIVLWILPGTQKFFNLWQETLEKLLVMFPLIMALIAAGRIFAFTVTDGENSGLDLYAFIFVLIGVFGPLILLPKTFQWGGRVFGQLAGFVNNPNRGIFDRTRKALDSRSEMARNRHKRESAERLHGTDYQYRPGVRGWGRKQLDRLAAGELDPTIGAADPLEARKRQLANRALARESSVLDAREQKQRQDLADLELSRINLGGSYDFRDPATGQTVIDAATGQPVRESGRDVIIRLAKTGNAEQKIAAIEKLIMARQFDPIESNQIHLQDEYSEAFNIKPNLFGTVAELRNDLLPPNIPQGVPRGAANVLSGGDVDSQGRIQPGMSAAQVVTQHPTFFKNAANDFEIMPDSTDATDKLQGAFERFIEIARDSQSVPRIAGSESERHINRILSQYASRTGQAPLTFKELVDRERSNSTTPPPSPPPPNPPSPPSGSGSGGSPPGPGPTFPSSGSPRAGGGSPAGGSDAGTGPSSPSSRRILGDEDQEVTATFGHEAGASGGSRGSGRILDDDEADSESDNPPPGEGR